MRLGTPDDYALRYLPQVLRRFADSHPSVEVEVLCAPSNELADRLQAGELDLTLLHRGQRAERLAARPSCGAVRCAGSPPQRHAPHRLDPLAGRTGQPALQLAQGGRGGAGEGRHPLPHRLHLGDAGRHPRAGAGGAGGDGLGDRLGAGGAARPAAAASGCRDLPDTAILLLKGREARQPVTDVLETHIAETFRAETRRAAAA